MQALGGGVTSGVSAVYAMGTWRVFARGIDGALWQMWFENGVWQKQSLGGQIVGTPGATMSDTLRVFARGVDNQVYQYYWQNNTWNIQGIGGLIS